LSCGRHKQEILCQLRELAKSGPTVKQDLDPLLRNQNISDETGKNSTEQQLFGACQPEKHATLQGQQVLFWLGWLTCLTCQIGCKEFRNLSGYSSS